MSYEHKNNRGTAFVNDKRESDKHPQMRGSAKIDGKDYWVSIWFGQTQKGDKKASLAFDLKDSKGSGSAGGSSSASQGDLPPSDDFDDDIPF